MPRTIKVTPNLTKGFSPELERSIRTSYPGQAHFANTGPFGRTCGECAYLGYWKQDRNANGDIVKTSRVGGCEKFFKLTGRHGAVVPTSASACRYFELRKKV